MRKEEGPDRRPGLSKDTLRASTCLPDAREGIVVNQVTGISPLLLRSARRISVDPLGPHIMPFDRRDRAL